MEYRVVCSVEMTKLTGKVNEMIKEGFKPFGSLAVSCSPGSGYQYLYQPMIKYDDDEKE